MIFYIRFLGTTIWRVHQDHIKFVIICIVEDISKERIVMIDLGDIQIMKEHIGNRQHIRKLFLFNSIDRRRIGFFISNCLYLLMKLFEPTRDKATCTASQVRHGFTNLRLYHLGHKVRYCTRCIELTTRSCAL